MSRKSNFNSYENDKKYDTNRAKWKVWSRGYSTHDIFSISPRSNVVADIGKNGIIGGVRL